MVPSRRAVLGLGLAFPALAAAQPNNFFDTPPIPPAAPSVAPGRPPAPPAALVPAADPAPPAGSDLEELAEALRQYAKRGPVLRATAKSVPATQLTQVWTPPATDHGPFEHDLKSLLLGTDPDPLCQLVGLLWEPPKFNQLAYAWPADLGTHYPNSPCRIATPVAMLDLEHHRCTNGFLAKLLLSLLTAVRQELETTTLYVMAEGRTKWGDRKFLNEQYHQLPQIWLQRDLYQHNICATLLLAGGCRKAP